MNVCSCAVPREVRTDHLRATYRRDVINLFATTKRSIGLRTSTESRTKIVTVTHRYSFPRKRTFFIFIIGPISHSTQTNYENSCLRIRSVLCRQQFVCFSKFRRTDRFQVCFAIPPVTSFQYFLDRGDHFAMRRFKRKIFPNCRL